MGSIYKITNTVNSKAYIGQTRHDAEKTRIRQHLNGYSRGSKLIKLAIEKYGKDAFTFEILHDGIIPEFLDTLEIEAIAKFNTVAPHGYNLTSGGNSGGVPSEETRRKISEAQKGRKHSEETRRKMSKARKGEKSYQYGKPLSEETRRKISEAQKGRKHSEETRRKMSETRKGRNLSEEHRQKISEAQKGEKNHQYGKSPSEETRRKMSEANRGKTPWNTGKSLSEETRQKMSEARKGEKNPNYGKSPSEETRRKISEANKSPRHPDYDLAREFFFSLSSDMPLTEKRRALRQKITNANPSTLYRWVHKWTKVS